MAGVTDRPFRQLCKKLGAGMAVGGWLIETRGPKVPFLAGAAIMAAVSLVALALPRQRKE